MGFSSADVVKQSLYDVLEVSRSASPAVIRAAYKSLAQRLHPDKNPDNPDAENQLKLINHAYETLSDPSQRAAYDVMLAMEEMQPLAAEEVPAEPDAAPAARRPFDRRILYLVAALCAIVLIAFLALSLTGEKARPPAAAPEMLKPAAVSAPIPVAPPAVQEVEPPASSPATLSLPAEPEKPVATEKPVEKPPERRPKPAVSKPEFRQEAKPAPAPKPRAVQVPPAAAPPAVRVEPEISRYADLASAVSSGDRAAVEKMIDRGGDVNQVRNNQVPLIIAVKNDDIKMVRLLLSRGADVNLTDNQGNTAMIYAKVRADAKMIEILKNAGAKNPFN